MKGMRPGLVGLFALILILVLYFLLRDWNRHPDAPSGPLVPVVETIRGSDANALPAPAPKTPSPIETRPFQTPELPAAQSAPTLSSSGRPDGLYLKVVDQGGTPVPQFSVELIQSGAGGNQSDLRTTDGQGGIPLGKWRARKAEGTEKMAARAKILSKSPTEVSIPLDLEAGEVRMVLPDCGSLEIEVVGPDGARLEEDVPIAAGVYGVPSGRPAFGGLVRSTHLSLTAKAGFTTLDWIECGSELEVKVGPSARYRAETVRIAGPISSGEPRREQVKLSRSATILKAQVLGENGEPLADTTITLITEAVHTKMSSTRHQAFGTTDEQGIVRAEVDPAEFWETSQHSAGSSKYRATVGTDRNTKGEWTKHLPWPLPFGEFDLGVFRIQTDPLVVGGTVVDSVGKPMRGISVSLLADPNSKRDSHEFMYLLALGAQTDKDGRFALRGLTQRREVSLTLRSETHALAQPVSVPVGSDNVKLVVEAAGTVQGWLRIDEGQQATDLLLSVLESASGEFTKISFEPHAGGVELVRFRKKGLRAGLYRLRVASLVIPGLELAAVDGLVVVGGGTCEDQRIQGLDLRGRLRPVEVRVLDDRGQELPHASVKVSGENGHYGREARTGADGLAKIWIAPSGSSVSVSKSGFLRQVHDNLTADVQIRMSVAPTMRLTIDWPASATEALMRGATVVLLGADEGKHDDASGAFPSEHSELDESGTHVLRPSHLGKRRLQITPENYHPFLAYDRVPIEPDPAEITIDAATGDINLRLKVSEAALAASFVPERNR